MYNDFLWKCLFIEFGDLFGLGYKLEANKIVAVPITIICVVGVINSLNLIDGIDGLCGFLTLIALFSICLIVKIKGVDASLVLILHFSAALIAYLLVNIDLMRFLIKKVFLGDAGTTIIGIFLCWHMIKLSNSSTSVFRPIIAVYLISLPIMDTLSIMLRRIKKNESPFKAGRDHIHHLLMLAGLSQTKTLFLLVGLSFLIAGIGVIAELKNIKESYMFYSFMFIFSLYHILALKLDKLYNQKSLI